MKEDKKEERKIEKDLFFIAVLTTVAVAVWIALDVHQALTKTEIPPIVKKQTEPLDPKLDVSILDQLEEKKTYDFSATETLTPPNTEQP